MLDRALAGLVLLLASSLSPFAVAAAESEWAASPEARARLIAATTAVGNLGELRLGLEIALAPKWKTYWRSPGEGGLPPRLGWDGSENLVAAEIAWPAPTRFQILGTDSIGYEKHVIYPLTVLPARPGEPVQARLTLDYLTCEEICVPQHAVLSFTLPAGSAEPSIHAFAIDKARGRVPSTDIPSGRLVAAHLALGTEQRWWLDLESQVPLTKPDAFIEDTNRSFAFGAPQQLGPTRLRLPVLYAETSPEAMVGERLIVTLTDGPRAFEQSLAVAPAAVSGGVGLGAWLAILATALAGGLILNLMPCVLPVLSIKLMGALRHGGGDRGRARASFLATAAGILVSFGALAVGAIALKVGGVAVGWGIQFQEPLFIAFMTLVCVLFAANLWGWFEIPLPAIFSRTTEGRLNEGWTDSFATGMVATLLATPCSAPFVGTAVAFGLGRGWVETLAIFLTMGMGLALPYLAVAVWPTLATSLPKPGRWMIWLRAVLGVALAATAAWLLSVLLSLSGLWVASALATVSLALLAWLRQSREGWRLPGAAAVIAAGLALPAALPNAAPSAGGDDALAGVWQPFSQARLAEEVAAGNLVLVDVTADWCITCQANKAAVLNRGEVGQRLAGNVVALKADWTRPDPAIQAYLASFDRFGIPFNAVYGPGAPAGLALPELLTQGAVLTALDRAASQ